MNLARAEFSQRRDERMPQPRLRLVPPLDDGLQQMHAPGQKAVRMRVWFDAHSPLRQFWYGKRGRKWNMADQATGGMKWNYYLASGKTTPMFGSLDPVQFVNDTIKKMESICKESENADETTTLEHKLNQIWTHAMAVLAHQIGSDIEIVFATHGMEHNEVEHQIGIVIPFPHKPHIEEDGCQVEHAHGEVESHHDNVVHLINHHGDDRHQTHSEHEHHAHGEHDGVVFEADAAMHPGHTRLIGGFWGSGHGHNGAHHGDQHAEQGHHESTMHSHQTHEGHLHEHHAHGQNHEGHHAHSTHGHHQEHEGDHHYNGHQAHGEHHSSLHHAHGEHEGALFESDAHLHPGHARLVGGFWGSGHGHSGAHHEHGDHSITGHSHQDHTHEDQYGDHRITGHIGLHLVETHGVDHPLHEGPMVNDDHSHGAVNVAHVLTNHERRVAQLKVANASAEPE